MAKFFLITVRATNVQLQKSPKLRAPNKLTISERQVSPSMKTQIFCRDGAPTVINGQRYGMTLWQQYKLTLYQGRVALDTLTCKLCFRPFTDNERKHLITPSVDKGRSAFVLFRLRYQSTTYIVPVDCCCRLCF